MTDAPPQDVMRRFGLTQAVRKAKTGIAQVWQVWRGADVFALKVYFDGDLQDEAPGFEYLKALGGRSCVRIYEQSGGAILMEWLDGASLGDMSRAGGDDEAAEILGQVASGLHKVPVQVSGLQRLDALFEDLFAVAFAPDCDAKVRRDMEAGQALARSLFANPRDVRALHGDMHHDNILQGPRGWCAIDAKGVVGERTYELAQAFCNPLGAPKLTGDPARAIRCAAMWAERFEVDQKRLLQWSAAKAALSVAWNAGAALRADDDADFLAVMLHVARAA